MANNNMFGTRTDLATKQALVTQLNNQASQYGRMQPPRGRLANALNGYVKQNDARLLSERKIAMDIQDNERKKIAANDRHQLMLNNQTKEQAEIDRKVNNNNLLQKSMYANTISDTAADEATLRANNNLELQGLYKDYEANQNQLKMSLGEGSDEYNRAITNLDNDIGSSITGLVNNGNLSGFTDGSIGDKINSNENSVFDKKLAYNRYVDQVNKTNNTATEKNNLIKLYQSSNPEFNPAIIKANAKAGTKLSDVDKAQMDNMYKAVASKYKTAATAPKTIKTTGVVNGTLTDKEGGKVYTKLLEDLKSAGVNRKATFGFGKGYAEMESIKTQGKDGKSLKWMIKHIPGIADEIKSGVFTTKYTDEKLGWFTPEFEDQKDGALKNYMNNELAAYNANQKSGNYGGTVSQKQLDAAFREQENGINEIRKIFGNRISTAKPSKTDAQLGEIETANMRKILGFDPTSKSSNSTTKPTVKMKDSSNAKGNSTDNVTHTPGSKITTGSKNTIESVTSQEMLDKFNNKLIGFEDPIVNNASVTESRISGSDNYNDVFSDFNKKDKSYGIDEINVNNIELLREKKKLDSMVYTDRENRLNKHLRTLEKLENLPNKSKTVQAEIQKLQQLTDEYGVSNSSKIEIDKSRTYGNPEQIYQSVESKIDSSERLRQKIMSNGGDTTAIEKTISGLKKGIKEKPSESNNYTPVNDSKEAAEQAMYQKGYDMYKANGVTDLGKLSQLAAHYARVQLNK